MEIFFSPRVNTMGIRRKMPDTREAKLVCQAEFAVASAQSKPNLIKTVGFGECLILSIISPFKRKGGLAHFDIQTLVQPSFEKVIMPEFRKHGCGRLQAQLVGGFPTRASEKLLRGIRDALLDNRIKIIGIDVNKVGGFPGLILDTASLELCDIDKPFLPDDAETLRRQGVALEYIFKNPKRRLIRLVE